MSHNFPLALDKTDIISVGLLSYSLHYIKLEILSFNYFNQILFTALSLIKWLCDEASCDYFYLSVYRLQESKLNSFKWKNYNLSIFKKQVVFTYITHKLFLCNILFIIKGKFHAINNPISRTLNLVLYQALNIGLFKLNFLHYNFNCINRCLSYILSLDV